MSKWWPIPWQNPPKGSNQAVIELANGRMFQLFDDEGRVKRTPSWKPPADPVIRYEVREIINGVMAAKYDRVDTLLELRALLSTYEQESYSPE